MISRDEILRHNICAFLAEIDAELASLAIDQENFSARLDEIKRLMVAPPFLTDGTAASDLPPPVVSVVLPTRNRAGVIHDAIASVQAQSFANWELIVVDDGSRDNTSDVVSEFLADPRIRYVAQDFSGHSAARNCALRLSRGSLVAYIDSDNLWYPHFLSAAVAVLTSFQDVDFVYGALVSEAHFEHPRTILFEDFDWERLLRQNYVDLNTVVHRKTLTEAYGGFDEMLNRLVDWDLLLRLTRDKPARRVPVLAAHYRVVDDQRVSVTCPFEPNYAAIQRKWLDGDKP
jgi:glycosyltransferase involved in cell wall biosynthesis